MYAAGNPRFDQTEIWGSLHNAYRKLVWFTSQDSGIGTPVNFVKILCILSDSHTKSSSYGICDLEPLPETKYTQWSHGFTQL
jgi:hypothetical protein